jgi:hypothetical protein
MVANTGFLRAKVPEVSCATEANFYVNMAGLIIQPATSFPLLDLMCSTLGSP